MTIQAEQWAEEDKEAENKQLASSQRYSNHIRISG